MAPFTAPGLPARLADGGAPLSNDLRSLLDLFLKRRLLILACVVIGIALALAATLLTRPLYTASVTVRIDREAEKVTGSETAKTADSLGEEFFATEYDMLRTHALSARVAQDLGLAQDRGFLKQIFGAGLDRMDPQARTEAVVDALAANQTVTPLRGSRLAVIGYRSPDPALSARIANAYAEAFIQTNLERRYNSSAYARTFLEQRLAQVRAKLEQSEKDLVAYAAQQQIIPLNGSTGNTPETSRSLPSADLESYAGALTTARADRIRAEQKWRQAETANALDIPEVQQNPTIQELSKDRARLKAEYQDKLRRFKPDYPDMVQLRARIDEIDHQITAEANSIRQALRVQFQAARQSEEALQRQVSGLKQDVISLRGRSIQYNILQREVDTNRTLYDGLLQRYKEIGVVGAVAASNVAVVDIALAPKAPSSPKPLLNIGLGLLGGLGLGLLLTLALEILDNAVRTPADVESKLGLAFLGAVPPLPKGVTPLEALADSRSPLSEAYFSLRAALQFSTVDGFPKSLLITSPWPGGGKSTTAFALAQNTARLGYRVLLIDADLRKPTQHTILNLENTLGLANLLTGEGEIEDLARATSLVNLHFIPSGVTPPNPAELLASDRFANLIARAHPV